LETRVLADKGPFSRKKTRKRAVVVRLVDIRARKLTKREKLFSMMERFADTAIRIYQQGEVG
jgi:hypothetical protein